jgi:hypothetical protein
VCEDQLLPPENSYGSRKSGQTLSLM